MPVRQTNRHWWRIQSWPFVHGRQRPVGLPLRPFLPFGGYQDDQRQRSRRLRHQCPNRDRPPRICPPTLAPARESGQDDCRTGKRTNRLWRTSAMRGSARRTRTFRSSSILLLTAGAARCSGIMRLVPKPTVCTASSARRVSRICEIIFRNGDYQIRDSEKTIRAPGFSVSGGCASHHRRGRLCAETVLALQGRGEGTHSPTATPRGGLCSSAV